MTILLGWRRRVEGSKTDGGYFFWGGGLVVGRVDAPWIY